MDISTISLCVLGAPPFFRCGATGLMFFLVEIYHLKDRILIFSDLEELFLVRIFREMLRNLLKTRAEDQ